VTSGHTRVRDGPPGAILYPQSSFAKGTDATTLPTRQSRLERGRRLNPIVRVHGATVELFPLRMINPAAPGMWCEIAVCRNQAKHARLQTAASEVMSLPDWKRFHWCLHEVADYAKKRRRAILYQAT